MDRTCQHSEQRAVANERRASRRVTWRSQSVKTASWAAVTMKSSDDDRLRQASARAMQARVRSVVQL